MTKERDMMGRDLLTLKDISDDELLTLLSLAAGLKRRKSSGLSGNLLERKHVVMIFEKMSTRTRCATVVAMEDEGGRAEYLSPHESHVGRKESMADTARVLARMFDGIMFRGYAQETIEKLAKYADVPVWNALTDEDHPTQAMADLMTIQETFGRLKGLKFVFVGDGRNNVANALMLGCAKAGVNFVNCAPPSLHPSAERVRDATGIARANGSAVSVVTDPADAVRGANVVYTDVWASMGEEAQLQERIRLLKPYQVNMSMMEATGNLKSGEVIFLHCLPAFHNTDTILTKDVGAMEVTDEVFESPFSKVFDEAENRMHTIKALMIATLCGVVRVQ